MSTCRHHNEWLSLLDVSGPFLSLPVLLKVFPNGLDAHNPENWKLLRLAYQEWQDALNNRRFNTNDIHHAWINFVLQRILELPRGQLLPGESNPSLAFADVPQYGETLHPDYILINPQTQLFPESESNREYQIRLLIQILPPEQNLEKPIVNKRWKASPATRMMELLHSNNIRLGLITNGEHWMLLNAPKGEATGYISWYSSLWLEENITLRAFSSLLGIRRFFGVDDTQILEQLLAESITDQQEVTNQLGYQVRKAVEVLVHALDRIDQDKNRTLLQGISETQLYEAVLTIMMRLVFMLSAEERGLMSIGNPIYDQYYAVSTIWEQLQKKADKEGEEILERRCDAWCRLLATFRAVYHGVNHEKLKLPGYGGSLFDPDRFAFLEGRKQGSDGKTPPSEPIPVNNRIVLHLLQALQILQVRFAGNVESRRLSFRALDIEQIGHVYEGLLDHTAVRASSPVLGLVGTKYQEPEINLADLGISNNISNSNNNNSDVESLLTPDRVKTLKKLTGKSDSALKKALETEFNHYEEQKLMTACNNDKELFQQVRPWMGLIRLDTLNYPMIIPAGSVYVTQVSDRRETGTHYTPRSLTEELVKHSLDPLVYEGAVEGKPQREWKLKPAAELLKLKICDPTMGSGAFLVQTCRYLGEKLVEAWDNAETAHPGKVVITPEGTLSSKSSSKLSLQSSLESPLQQSIIPQEADERLIVARRIIADRCLYGVDKNPLAVEMAKLSLWLITLQKNRPFTFLDHALKCGDSLIGVGIEQLGYWNLNLRKTAEIFANEIRYEVDKIIKLRKEIIQLPVLTSQDQNRKEYLLARVKANSLDLVQRCNLLVGSYLNNWHEKEQEGLRQTLLINIREGTDIPQEKAMALPDFEKLRPFHWELEFPEVFIDHSVSLFANASSTKKNQSANYSQGFDAIVGNPPFMGGQKITGNVGTEYRDFLVKWLANGKKGSADLCAYFFLRAKHLLQPNGVLGMIATNTIAQGDTREVGLDQLIADCTIYRAVPSRTWPGTASLEVAYVWLKKGGWKGNFILDEKPVGGITAFLTVPGKVFGNPERLVANQNKSFQGSIVLGMGFVLTPEEAEALIEKDPRNKDVLFPYLNGEDLNTSPDQSPSRWVINFRDWPLDAEHDNPKNPQGAPYASDYPDCLAIVREKVKPERDKNKDKQRREIWWRFTRPTVELYRAIANMEKTF